MKHTKKLASLLLVLVMVLSVAATAFAGQEGSLRDGAITINNAVVGQTYKIYQILYLESYNLEEGAYVYKANSAWKEWLKKQTKYVSLGADDIVTWVGDATEGRAAEFAKLAQAYATEESMDSDAYAVTADSATVSFTNLMLGYYLVDSTLGTLCSLDTTNPAVTIKEKNEAPTNEKTVEEDSDGKYDSVDDADIGQTVNFKSTVTLPAGSENVVFHDAMSEGLTLDVNSIKVYTDAAMTTEFAGGNYTVTSAGLSDGCDFEILFMKSYLDDLTASTTVYVKYSATVNENAVVGGDGNTNESRLSYGDKDHTTTTPGSKTTTYTWSFDVLKYGDGKEDNVLSDAEFVLLNHNKRKVAIIEKGKLTGWTDVLETGTGNEINWPENTVLATDTDGKITINGLDADTYYLREIKAPDGYNRLAEDNEVKIEPTQGTDADNNPTLTLAPVTVKVNNQFGNELPSTGGIGTTIFYILGAILVVGAGVLLIIRRRMSREK